MTNITNATAPAFEPAANTTTIISSNTTHLNTTSSNSTNTTANNVNDEAMLTTLTFGPLSSCITLPDLSAALLPRSASNLSASAVQSWLTSLPTSSSCSSFSWTMKPDYSEHLNSMASFQQQFEQLFPMTNSTLAGQSGVNTSTVAGNGSFFGSTPAMGLDSGANGKSLPTGLPVWMGVTMTFAVFVHLIALVLHICSDLEALLPSFAAKLHSLPDESLQLGQVANGSSATLVDAKTDAKAEGEGEGRVADPPGYTEPAPVAQMNSSVDQAARPTPALIRMSRKAKRLIVPLLLLSALGSIGVAVVLNSKFAAGPITSFPTSLGGTAGGSASAPASSVLPATSSTNTSSGASASLPTATASEVANSTRQRTNQTIPDTTSTINPSTPDRDMDTGRPADSAPTATTTPSMTRIVKRQNFFPTISPSQSLASSSSSLPPVSNSTSSAASSATSSTPLFPSMPISTSLSSTTTSLSAVPATTTATSTNGTDSTTPSASDAGSSSLFVLEKGGSMHRIWWIVMLDLLLWFAQRRRTRSQIAMDQARATILNHLTPSQLSKV